MAKLDLKKELKPLYHCSAQKPTRVEAPEARFLMIDGRGDPNTSPLSQGAVAALFGLAFKTKFASKKELGRDYVVMPLEGLWWAEDMADFDIDHKADWLWRLLIRQPDWIAPELVDSVRDQAAQKADPGLVSQIQLGVYNEGPAVQIMHRGPFADEGPTVARLHRFIDSQGWRISGRHHEIYLGDFRKAAPDKLRTIIRQPIA